MADERWPARSPRCWLASYRYSELLLRRPVGHHLVLLPGLFFFCWTAGGRYPGGAADGALARLGRHQWDAVPESRCICDPTSFIRQLVRSSFWQFSRFLAAHARART